MQTWLMHRAGLLFVDDDHDFLGVLAAALSARERLWRPRLCATPGEALEHCAREPFDIVISDLFMPQMSGPAFLQAAAKIQPEASFVILSGAAAGGALIDAVNKAPVAAVMEKPLRIGELTALIERVLKKRAERRASTLGLGAARAAIDSAAEAALVLRARDLCILFANARAQALLAAQSGLSGALGRRLATADKFADASLRAACAALASESRARQTLRLQLPGRQSGHFALTLRLASCDLAGEDGGGERIIAVFIDPTPSVAPADSQMLAQTFRLTPAESRLAAELARGESLRSAAQALAITEETARTYLKRIFHKTGVHRQAELVLLMANATRGGRRAA